MMNYGGICGSGLVILGCFLPWVNVGVIFVRKGIETPDGAIVILLGLGSMILSLYNILSKKNLFRPVYALSGVGAIVIAYLDVTDLVQRAQSVQNSWNEMSHILGQSEVQVMDFIGMGLLIVFLGGVVLVISSFLKPQIYSNGPRVSFPNVFEGNKRNIDVSGRKRTDFQEVIFCPFCGSELLDQALFCHNCGEMIPVVASEQNEDLSNMSDSTEVSRSQSEVQLGSTPITSNSLTSFRICPKCGNHNAPNLEICSQCWERIPKDIPISENENLDQ